MDVNLIKLEEKLRSFFEDRLWFQLEGNTLVQFTRKIIEKILLFLSENEFQNISEVKITIHTHWKKILDDPELSRWVEYIQSTVSDEIGKVENPSQIPVPVQVNFSNKYTNIDQFKVVFSAHTQKKTAKLEVRDHLPKIKDIIPGYLITPENKVFDINKTIINIGRIEKNELFIDNLRISRVHAQIRQMENSHMIFDLDSTGGTFVNGIRITQKRLVHGDVIKIADTPLIYINNTADKRIVESGLTKVLKTGVEEE